MESGVPSLMALFLLTVMVIIGHAEHTTPSSLADRIREAAGKEDADRYGDSNNTDESVTHRETISDGFCSNIQCSPCQRDLNQLLFNASDEQLQALDAFGRPAAGLLAGNAAWFGHFSQCTHLEDFQYCLIQMKAKEATLPVVKNRKNIGIKWGVCVPKTCNEKDIPDNMDALLEFMRVNFNTQLEEVSPTVSCVSRDSKEYPTSFYVTVSLFAALLALMILGSIVDYMEPSEIPKEELRPDGTAVDDPRGSSEGPRGDKTASSVEQQSSHTSSIWKQFLLAFAFTRNFPQLMDVKSEKGDVACLHGIRAISMLWVIFGHVLGNDLPVDIHNPVEKNQLRQTVFFDIIVTNTTYAVDTFCFLSGLLVCYTTLIKLDRQGGKIRWGWFYVHRYLRLTPILGAAFLINSNVVPHLSFSPMMLGLPAGFGCANWWRNFLYIQNLYGFFTMCYHISWYLAVDMQLFVISPVLIYALYKKPALGVGLISAVTCAACLFTGYKAILLNLPASSLSMISYPGGLDMYIQAYPRAPPYMVGMLLGFVIYKTRGIEMPTLPKVLTAVHWVAIIFILDGIMIPLIGHHGPIYTNPSLGRGLDVAFQTLSRLFWGIMMATIVGFCHFGGPGLVNNILSWKCWVPLSRCSFSAYLLHLVILGVYQMQQALPMYHTYSIQIFTFLGITTATYMLSMLLYTAIQLPVTKLERLFLPRA